MKPKYELISIGDCTIDAFIKLHNASIHCDLNHQNRYLCITFADKVPYESLKVVSAVGNSSNVAVAGARLGLRSAAFTAVGGDYYGRQILDVYQKEKVGTEFVKINRQRETNYHFVLNFRAERTILIKHNSFEYFNPSRLGQVGWVYFSSMGEHASSFYPKLAAFLKTYSAVRMAFNPGTFQLQMGAKRLRPIYRKTFVLFVNREEAQRILGIRNRNVKTLFRGLHKLGPQIVAITDGPAGAYASDQKNQYFMPIYPDPKTPVERTGAGDSFAAGFFSALIYGLPVIEALRWGPVNAMNVVQHIGAQEGLLEKQQLLRLLRNAPKHYRPKNF